jgi:hypothetical protein
MSGTSPLDPSAKLESAPPLESALRSFQVRQKQPTGRR